MTARADTTRAQNCDQPQADSSWQTFERRVPAPRGSTIGFASASATKNSYSLAFMLSRELPGSAGRKVGITP